MDNAIKTISLAIGMLVLSAPGLCLAEGHAQGHSKLQLGASGGVFYPWHGDTGYEVGVSLMWPFGSKRAWRAGGEVSFRDASSEFFNVEDVDVKSIRISPQIHYVFKLGPVSPYLGVGLAIGINVIDPKKIERERPNVDVFSRVGGSFGAMGIVGIEVLLGDRLLAFVEGRVGADAQLTSSGDIDVENIGGVSGIAGMRLLF